MNAVVVTKIECDERLIDSNDNPYTEELLAVFVDDVDREQGGVLYTAQQKAQDFVNYVNSNSDKYTVEDAEYPQYDFRFCRCY